MTELAVSMLPHRYKTLCKALYGEEHGFGERILRLELMSGQENLDIRIPVLCRYKDNTPSFATTIHKDYWPLLCNIVVVDGQVKVIFDDGERNYLAKLMVLDAKPPSDGGVVMRL
jgi:hypothetical protein